MIRNYYFLVAGILAIIFSITHAMNGQNTVLPSLDISAVSIETKSIFFYVWHIITAENFIFGIAFLLMAFYKTLPGTRFAAWMIAVIMIARWAVIFAATMLYNAAGLKNILVDSIAIALYVLLIILGTRVKERQAKV